MEGLFTDLYTPKEVEKINKAYEIAEKALEGRTRGNGHPFIEHALGVATIVASEIGLNADAVLAVFLHEAVRFSPELFEEITAQYPKGKHPLFPQDIIEMAANLNKISSIKPKDTRLEADNYRKLIISYSTDPRVTLIKLADRLEVMRNLELLPKSNQQRKITETIMLYVPLAHQLNLYNIKSEMENLYLRYAEPEQYRAITNKLKATEKDRDKIVSDFIIPLREKLDKSGIRYELKSRTKSAYSIWKKMLAQNVPFEGVYDLFAIRFIIDSPPEKEKEHELCWRVYSEVTDEYTPDTSRLRDWITNPKPNGYESLHTTVKNRDDLTLEVQIRTKRMDYNAESGQAAHWSYKGIKRETSLESWLSNVKKMLESSEGINYQPAGNLSLNEIFVFTPTGDLRRLPVGACVLDFAFEIHSNLGLRCAGAKIDGKAVSIRERLVTGNVVDIMTNKNQKPSPDWLNFVITSKARSKIKQKLKEEELKKSRDGKELLERRLKNWKLEITDEILHELCKKYKFKNINELYSAVGEGGLDPVEIKGFIKNIEEYSQSTTLSRTHDEKAGSSRKEDQSDFLIIDGKLNNVGYKMAKCCNPVFGDDVFGFVSIKEGVKIHRISCPNAARLIENYPYRILKVKWRVTGKTNNFQTALKITADDDYTIGQSVIDKIHSFNIPLRSFYVQERDGKKSHEIDIFVQVAISNNQQLDKLISTIKKIKGVNKVLRSSNG